MRLLRLLCLTGEETSPAIGFPTKAYFVLRVRSDSRAVADHECQVHSLSYQRYDTGLIIMADDTNFNQFTASAMATLIGLVKETVSFEG